jgi:hypothetical protein
MGTYNEGLDVVGSDVIGLDIVDCDIVGFDVVEVHVLGYLGVVDLYLADIDDCNCRDFAKTGM